MALLNPPEPTALEPRRTDPSAVIDQPDRQTAQSASPQSSTWTSYTTPRGATVDTPEFGRFFGSADTQDPDLAMGWRLLAVTGMRRGEALALRWPDVALDVGRLAVCRSVGVVKAMGAGERLVEGPTKTGRPQIVDLDAGSVDLDAGTVAALRLPGRPRRAGP